MILSQYPNPLGLSPLSYPNQATSSTYTANVHFKSILAIKSIKKKKKNLAQTYRFFLVGNELYFDCNIILSSSK